ncbi:MAG: hypothetical protein R3E53_00925 [Myxococcota bacterium]
MHDIHPFERARPHVDRVPRRAAGRRLAVGLLLVWALACAAAERAPDASSDAGPITRENLYEHDAYWPYRVNLVGDWRPSGFERAPGWGVGILVRVERSGLLRVDFASDGRFLVPADATDVIEQANRLHAGLDSKSSPNLRLTLGTRMLDPSGGKLRPLARERLDRVRSFLVLYADPSDVVLREASEALGPWMTGEDPLLLLMPQGDHRDGTVANLARDAGWESPFVFDRYAPGYTASLLDDAARPPFVQLLSAEGRLLFEAPWDEAIQPALRRALGRLTPAE